MATAGTVLVVDDDPDMLKLYQAFLLNKDYQVLSAETGQQGLAILADKHKEIEAVISDVQMPEIDGYQFCAHVKTNPATQNMPFIFVSAQTSLEEKLKGYEVGGDDYVTKPVNPEELLHKVKNVINIHRSNLAMQQQLNESFNTAIQAMSYSSELGQVLEFYKNSLDAKNYEAIVEHLFSTTRNLGLSCSIQIYTPDKTYNFSDKGKMSPLEANVIELARNKGRFFDLGKRTFINYDSFCLLIKNMPTEDEHRYGTLKDTLGSLCNAIDSRVSTLLHYSAAAKKEELLTLIDNALNEITASYQSVQKANIAAIEDMQEDLEAAIMIMNLTEKQENELIKIASKCLQRSNEAFYKSVSVSQYFDEIRNLVGRSLH